MTSDEWRQAATLLDRALGQPQHERRDWVRAHAPSDEVCTEVWSLLDAHERPGGFLDIDVPLEGRTLGPYRIVRRVGQGGMGVVFEAEDTRLHRPVAIKMLPPGVAENEDDRHRLRREARAAAALTHPGIATVYALEEIDGHLFIVSELLVGQTLREELARGPLPLTSAIDTAVGILRALVAAHDRGIVHRDLKPENIVRTREGDIKILDFGIAKFEPDAHDLLSIGRPTDLGAMLGTPSYMAPEQLLNRPIDPRTDQFAFGALLYELIEGRTPFGDGSLPTIVARVLAGETRRPAATGAMPDEVWQVVQRCLQADPQARFPTTRDLLAALEGSAGRVPSSSPVPSHPVVPDSRPLMWWRFHQLATFAAYWAMVWPVWHAHQWMGRFGLWIFLAVLGAIIVGANLRLHLWFSSRVYARDLPAQRARVAPLMRAADIVLALLLVGTGAAIGADHAGWAALFVGFGIGSALVFLIVEPATARAAFGRGVQSTDGAKHERSKHEGSKHG